MIKSFREGESVINSEGFTMSVLNYRTANDMDIVFKDGTIKKGVRYSHFQYGKIKRPFESRIGKKFKDADGLLVEIIEYIDAKCVSVLYDDGFVRRGLEYASIARGSFLKNKSRVGAIHCIKYGYKATIIEYFSSLNCTVKINDWNNTILYNVDYSIVKNGTLKNYFHKKNNGYLGLGDFNSKTECGGIKPYHIWRSIIERCYNKNNNRHISYRNVAVSNEWMNFQNFGKWFKDNYDTQKMRGWHLDKDLFSNIENKIYSAETCCFIPNEINCLFKHVKKNNMEVSNKKFKVTIRKKYIGVFETKEKAYSVYKEKKEEYIKEKAREWQGKITDRVYSKMMDYKI